MNAVIDYNAIDLRRITEVIYLHANDLR